MNSYDHTNQMLLFPEFYPIYGNCYSGYFYVVISNRLHETNNHSMGHKSMKALRMITISQSGLKISIKV